MKLIFSFFLLFVFFTATAQEVVRSLGYNAQLYYGKGRELPPRVRAANDTLILPFFDDFSYAYKSQYPDPNLWEGIGGVYVNNTYPADPISIGVATFDGLNVYGVPRDTGGSTAAGDADTLTSLPIDLSSFTPGDSIYLSFFYEAQGYGDYPNVGDSLNLLFHEKINDTTYTWSGVWGVDGPNAPTPPANQHFIQVMIPITNPIYLYKGFQFRFHNIATLSGNNDHWHLDYIKIARQRTLYDTTVNDVAIQYMPTSFLKNYQAMPWSQFQANPTSEIGTSHNLRVRNNFEIQKNVAEHFTAKEIYSGTSLANSPQIAIDMNHGDTTFNNNVFTPTGGNTAGDSANVAITYSINADANDTYLPNDTLVKTQNFYNYYAHDDGSAEKAYAVLGKGAQLAYHFYANKPDTLRAIQIQFAHILTNVHFLLISLRLWDTLTTKGIIYEDDFLFPTYVDSINGFYTYVFDSIVKIPKGNFYIGFVQSAADEIDIGMDENTNSQTDLYYNIGSGWVQSAIAGSLLMRPLVGHALPWQYTGVTAIKSPGLKISVYPNPVDEQLNIGFNGNVTAKYSIMDCMGRTVLQSNQLTSSIDVHHLSSGLYLLKIDDKLTGKTFVTKFIKTE